MPAHRRGECQCAKLVCSPGCVSGQLLRPVVPALHDGGGDGYHGVSITHPGTGAPRSPQDLTCLPPPPQVLCCLLLPSDAGHGGGLWREGSTAQHPEGRAHGGQHWALLLLLPLPAPNHHEQVRESWDKPLPLEGFHLLLLLGWKRSPWAKDLGTSECYWSLLPCQEKA